MKRVVFAVLILLATSCPVQAIEMAEVGGLHPEIPSLVGYVPNRIVVKFDPQTLQGIDRAAMARGRTGIPALDQVGAQYGIQSLRPQFPGAKNKIYKGKLVDLSGWHVVEFPGRANVLAIVERYKATPGVLNAEPVAIHKVDLEPNDYNYNNWPTQWHLPKIQAPEAWSIATGDSSPDPPVIVAVLDTGVRYFHGDLGGNNITYDYYPYQGKEIAVPVHDPAKARGNMWINPNPSQTLLYQDDWIGWDFVNVQDNWPLMVCYPGEDCLEQDNDPRDFQGHGTHCAGNVASMNNNSYSQASVAGGWGDGNWASGPGNGVRVMSLRIGWRAIYGLLFDLGLVDLEAAAEALVYAADHGARIASCSWGSSDSPNLKEAIQYFLASGGLIFKAAGNDSTETADFMCEENPDFSNVICVAATDQDDCKASFSTYGTWVDISAPGVGIWSSWHNADDPGYPELNWNGWDWINYPEGRDWIATMDGTSMSTPLAASVAALIWSHNPGWTADQVKQRLFDSADSSIYNNPCNSPFAGKLGAGRIDAYRAVSGTSASSRANFEASPTSGDAPLDVTFTDRSTCGESPCTWSWDFGDGATSNDQTPLPNTYTEPGSYTVSLTVTDSAGGEDIETKTGYITVTDGSLSKVGVDSLETGIYGTTGHGKDKRTAYYPTDTFVPGDEVIIRAWVVDSDTLPVSGASVNIRLTYPGWDHVITSGTSDSGGLAEAKWKTASAKGRSEPTKAGEYTATVIGVTASDGLPWDGTGTSITFTITAK